MSKILHDPIVSELELQYQQLNSNLGLKIVAEEENLIFHSRSSMLNKKVLELGCGIYPASCGIKDENMPENYHATDFDKKLIEIAKKQDERIKTSIINLHKLNEIDVQIKFDLIFLKGVLHHIKDFQNVLEFCKKILNKNGYIIIAEPNLKSIPGNLMKYILKKLFNINLESSPYGQIPYDKLIDTIENNNFKIVEKWYSRLIAFLLSGSLGRIKIVNNKFIFKIAIKLDKFLNYLFGKININKYIFFIVHLKIQPK